MHSGGAGAVEDGHVGPRLTGAGYAPRKRLSLRREFALALLPTATVLVVFGTLEVFTRQQLLFASLASSAVAIYLDPRHTTSAVRTLVLAQMGAATLGLAAYLLLGPGYWSGGLALMATIALMILANAVHPPAASTSLSFAYRAGDESNLVLFGLAVGLTAMLVVLQRVSRWLLERWGE